MQFFRLPAEGSCGLFGDAFSHCVSIKQGSFEGWFLFEGRGLVVLVELIGVVLAIAKRQGLIELVGIALIETLIGQQETLRERGFLCGLHAVVPIRRALSAPAEHSGWLFPGGIIDVYFIPFLPALIFLGYVHVYTVILHQSAP